MNSHEKVTFFDKRAQCDRAVRVRPAREDGVVTSSRISHDAYYFTSTANALGAQDVVRNRTQTCSANRNLSIDCGAGAKDSDYKASW